MLKIIFFLFFSNLFISIKSAKLFDYSHEEGSQINIQVGSVSSNNYIIPYSYKRLQICNANDLKRVDDNLGEIFSGDDLYLSNYFANINENKYCALLCSNQFMKHNLKILRRLIERDYHTNWYVDYLPAGLIKYNPETKKEEIDYFSGIPLGKLEDDKFIIYNHLHFKILINKEKSSSDNKNKNKYNIVGVSILPVSIEHDIRDKNISCPNNYLEETKPQYVYDRNFQTIKFSYDIVFENSDITLASRWDHYKTSDQSIHWKGILVSISILTISTLGIAILLTNNIKKDIDNYNYQVVQIEDIDNIQTNTTIGKDWKQVSGDVFRPPRVNKMLLCSIVGTGFQIFSMFFLVLTLGTFGYLNPEMRGKILSLFIFFYILMGAGGGYISADIYKIMGGKNWLKMSLLTSILFPGILFLVYFIVNILLIFEKSNIGLNLYDLGSLFFLWVFCTLPLILIGTFLGMKSKRIKLPCKVNKIPRKIPDKPWYLHYRYLACITGLLGFLTILFELNYIMQAIWKHELYFVVPFLWMSYSFFIAVSGEISIIVVFWNLCYGDYNWWWKSFLVGSSPVIYFIIYSIYYFLFDMNITRFSSIIIYFGIMGIISTMALFVCGSISVLICLGFILRIYSDIKID